MSAAANPLDLCLVRWRNNLIDLTRRNPLLALRPGRSNFVELRAPDLTTLFATLALEGKPLRFWLPAAAMASTPHGPPFARGGEERPQPPLRGEEVPGPPLRRGGRGGLAPPSQVPPKAGEIVCADHEGQPHDVRVQLTAVLTNLYRRAQADYRERGLHILHLALGILEWRDTDDAPMRSPLVLLPVALSRPSLQEPFVLAPTEEDALVNPALTVRLQQEFDFRLPAPPADWEEKPADDYLSEVQAAIAGLPGWKVERRAFLSLFSFFKGVMHQDLEENAERIKAHPVIQALAGVAPPPKPVPLPSETQLDDRPDAQGPHLILDADGSQRLCLEAAAGGEAFVLIGPPGTGKSQTIANLIADRIAQGKKILFVSEKMAALEVVYQRLRHVGLGDYCLEVHSHKASKRAVVTELARCLEAKTSAAAPLPDDDLARLEARRGQLNAYVRALHQRRPPLGKSVWDALAELPRWQAAPFLPLEMPLVRTPEDASGQLIVTEITQTQLDDLQQFLYKLQRFWHIRPDANFPWWGFKADKFHLQLRDEVVGLIDKVRVRFDKLHSTAEAYAGQLDVQGPTAWLLRLGELLESKPAAIPAPWFTLTDWSALKTDLERCAEQHQRLGQARAPLTARYGTSLWSLPEGTASRLGQAWKGALPWLAGDDASGALLWKHQQSLRGWAADTLKRLPGWLTEIRTLEKWLAVPLPVGAGETAGGEGHLDPAPEAVKHFVRLAHLCLSDHLPQRAWVQNEQELTTAQAVIGAAKPILARYRERRARLLQTYTESLFELDLERIARGYEGPYRSWFRILNGQYRRDRRDLRRRTHQIEVPATVAQDVLLGRDVVVDKKKLEEDAPRRAAVLGRYERGLDSDFDDADKATRVAAEAVRLVRELGSAELPPRLLDALCATAPPQEKLRAAVKRLNESYNAWAHATEPLQAQLPMQHLPGVGAPLDECALSALQHYARDLQNALNTLAVTLDPILAGTKTGPADLATLLADLRQAEELRHFEATQATEDQRWRERFGPGFLGLETNWEALKKALVWTQRLREHWAALPANPPALPQTLLALLEGNTLPSAHDLRHAQDLYEQALHVFEHRFEANGPLLDGKPLHAHPVETVAPRLQVLRDRAGELADWVDWRHLPDRFHHLGLRSFWDRLQHATWPREQVVDVFLKAFWTSWVEAWFQEDAALGQFRRVDHERTLAEFRDLDRRAIAAGAARVVDRCGQPDVSELGSEVALLLKEAHKKSKHWPLRRLFDAIPTLLPRLKPCLLMSPLSVSQFLPDDPAKLHFDLVVFDEASQILPEDAVGAIARGRQAVISGDNQQLPPTTFFTHGLGEEDEETEEAAPLYESILDACLAAGLPQRLLRWHYRSRHEHLIAFSNQRFYDGRLMTFPAAQARHPDLGVRFHHVPDGIYDRGGRRDNPREAEVVADLVLQQVRAHPDLSVGVIAFSFPQMDAIQDALDRLLELHPELERHFHGDRLEGFFVKNLETVQGDERDVIFLSVGYGRDDKGKLIQNFGPVNREGGARRLNVAVTRARRQLTVVSSIRAGDLSEDAASVAHLRQYLDFAERGLVALALDDEAGQEQEPAHPLQADVRDELRRLGFDAAVQVGCGPYPLDLGVLNPHKPGHFLLGIEFDGPGYHHVGPARDRDRLRPELLTKLGWRLHRIWAPDWLQRRAEEVERLKAALGEL